MKPCGHTKRISQPRIDLWTSGTRCHPPFLIRGLLPQLAQFRMAVGLTQLLARVHDLSMFHRSPRTVNSFLLRLSRNCRRHHLLWLVFLPHWPGFACIVHSLANGHQVDVGQRVHVLDETLVRGQVALTDREPGGVHEHSEGGTVAQIVALKVALHPLEHRLLVVLWPGKSVVPHEPPEHKRITRS